MKILKKEITKRQKIFKPINLSILLLLTISFQTFGQNYCTLRTKTGFLVKSLYISFEHVMYISPNDATIDIVEIYPLNKIPSFSYEKTTRCIKLQPDPMRDLDLIVKYKNKLVDTLHIPVNPFALKFDAKLFDKNNKEITRKKTLKRENISRLRVIINANETITDLIGLEFFCNLKITLTKGREYIEYNYPLTNNLPKEIELDNTFADATNILFQLDKCEIRKPSIRNICWPLLINCKIKN